MRVLSWVLHQRGPKFSRTTTIYFVMLVLKSVSLILVVVGTTDLLAIADNWSPISVRLLSLVAKII